MADSAGGRSQLAQLTTSAVVLIVLLLLTRPLASLPIAALAAIVFLIAAGLIDVTGMRRIMACRRPEFAIALLTTAAVVILGVEEGIVLAVVASVIDHLRHSYNPLNSVLVKSPAGHWLRWVVLDCAAIGDVDYTAAAVLTRVIEHLRRHLRPSMSQERLPASKRRNGPGSGGRPGSGSR